MRLRRSFVPFMIACVALLALPSLAAASVPKIFAGWGEPYTNSAVKPSHIGSFTGDGSAYFGNDPGKKGAVVWRTWNRREARARGKFWINDGIPDMAGGTFHGHWAKIRAYRVRSGHYTRFSAVWYGGPDFWDAGSTRHVDRYRLTHWGGGLFWGRFD
jgi:hypothetical protein